MNNGQFFEEYQNITKDLTQLAKKLADNENQIAKVMQSNVELKVENGLLRKKIQEMENPNQQKKTISAKEKLEQLYNDGIHVCALAYGSRRVNGEDCAFCLDVIYHQVKEG